MRKVPQSLHRQVAKIMIAIAAVSLFSCETKREKSVWNPDLMSQLNTRKLENLSVMVYKTPSRKNHEFLASSEFAVALRTIYQTSLSSIDETFKKNMQKYDLLYIQIKDHQSRDYCMVKIHVSPTREFLRIFPNANSGSYRGVNLVDEESKEVGIVRRVVEESIKHLK